MPMPLWSLLAAAVVVTVFVFVVHRSRQQPQPDQGDTALALLEVGDDHWRKGHHAEAEAAYDQALPLLCRWASGVHVARALTHRAEARLHLNRCELAEQDCTRVLSFHRAFGLPSEVASCLLTRGDARLRQADADDYRLRLTRQRAIADYDEAQRLFQLSPSTWLQAATCQLHRACAWQMLGDHARAVADYDAILIGKEVPTADQRQAADHLLNWADALGHLGEYSRTVAICDRALKKFRKQKRSDGIAACLVLRGDSLAGLGDFARAVCDYDEALLLFDELGYGAHVGRTLANRSWALARLGRYSQAAEDSNEALDLLRLHDRPGDVAVSLMTRADSLTSQGEHGQALEVYREALPLLLEHGRATDVRACLLNQASTLTSLGDYDDAIAVYERFPAGPLKDDDQAKYHAGYADALYRVGRVDQAFAEFGECLKALRRARQVGGIDETSLGFVAERQGILARAVAYAIKEERIALAFEFAQEGKASVLGDQRQDYQSLPSVDSIAVLLSRMRLVDQLEVGPPGWELDEYLEAFRFARHGDVPPRTASADAAEVATLAQVQAALPADWALLDFWQVDESRLIVFVVRNDDLDVVSLRPLERGGETFQTRLDFLRTRLENPLVCPPGWDEIDGDAVWDDLHDHVLADLLPRLQDVKGLYLVPHSFWHAIPLHASRWFDRSRCEQVYLSDRFAVAYLPSAALLPQLPPLRLEGRMLSLANPDRGRASSTLPFSEWEARVLAERLPFDDKEFHAGEEATMLRTETWEGTSLLHFTCHGLGDPQFAPLSRLLLRDDCLLAHDVVYRHPPLAEGALVVLNGCQTAVRDWRAVDEGLGLMTAFLLRGASLVLATQWSVIDHCAAELVASFLTGLVTAGASPTEALRQAQRWVRDVTPARIVERCGQVAALFPADENPHEAAKVEAMKQAAARGMASDPGQGGFYDDPIYWAPFQLVGRVT